MFIADTDVLIDYLRGAGEAERIVIELGTGRLCTTAITAFELWAGSKSPQQIAAVESLLAAVTVLPLDVSSTRRAGEVRRDLERGGRTIGMADSLIAGIALSHEAILITRNREHYERVPGLKLTHQFR
ncbi:MAG: type II toxin-antitoxin system VapC family toxin [Acidobacteriota bacterium]|jgi:predicted nucleic acid-binding protein